MRSVSAIERFTGSNITIHSLPSQSDIRALQIEKILESFRIDLKKMTFGKEKEVLQQLLNEGYHAEDVAAAILHRILPKHDTTESALDDQPNERKQRRRKHRDRPNARRDSRKPRRPDIHRGGGKRSGKKRRLYAHPQP